jgi:UPF0755 protein
MRLLRRLLLLVLLAALALTGAAAWWVQRPLPLAGETAELSVAPGASVREIARGWVGAGVEASPWLLYQWFRWSGDARRIRAGSYEIGAGTSPRDLLRKMIEGDETLARVRLIDGWTFRQWRAELARAGGLRPDTAGMDDAAVMAALGRPGELPEGRFFPDTYAYARGSSDLAVMRRALHAMDLRLARAWDERAADIPLRHPQELLILASIVEKETGRAAERPMIASVFVNRLRIGMPLQTDPTVIYGLGERFDGNLRKVDLLTDTPWNTYTRNGLPPTPIAMPGAAALAAAARPAVSKALYFVARGDGSSEFSTNLADHNRAVNRYQRGQGK